MADDPYVVSVERVIPALAERIFPLVADPSRHREIDGSCSVRDVKDAPSESLHLGSQFGMHMKVGIPYSMVNTVIEFEPDRRIAWQTRPPTSLGKFFGGRIWRYELEPTDGGTLVRETWDLRQERGKQLIRRAAGDGTREAMERTLERIDTLVSE
jgi:uncharacterized protein YndB with AHSA1/START domain